MASTAVLNIFQDTGAPSGSTNYTTLVVLHGMVWHSAAFARLLPLAHQRNTRIILVNRQEHPGGSNVGGVPPPSENAWLFMQHRATKLNEFLKELVRRYNIPLAQPAHNAGGIILAGWSLGVAWATAFLTHVTSFPKTSVDLSKYVRRVILYEGSNVVLGYPPTGSASSGQVREHDPLVWVSEYFAHGDSSDTLRRNHPSAFNMLGPEQVQATIHGAQASPEGSDRLLLDWGVRTELFSSLRKRALYPPALAMGAGPEGREWNAVEVRVVWGDQSIWEVLYAVHTLKAELADASTRRLPVRNVTLARIGGANHFAHWDHPEKTLHAFLARASEIEG